MKQILVTVLFFHYISARPHYDKDAEVTLYENVDDGSGNYRFAFQTTNGIAQEQDGQFQAGAAVKGFFSFTAPDNSVNEVRYVSDENGYQPRVFIRSAPPNPTNSQNSDLNQPRRTISATQSPENQDALEATRKFSLNPQVGTEKGPLAQAPLNKVEVTHKAAINQQKLKKVDDTENEDGLSTTQPGVICTTTGLENDSSFCVDDKLGKAVMITILGTGG